MPTRAFLPFFVLLLASCTGTEKVDSGDTDTEADGPVAASVSGTITWNTNFNATAEAEGAVDCAYTRTYSGIEDRSAPWLCPQCDLVFLADATVSEGLDECYYTVTDLEPAETEWLGFGGGEWYRGSGGWLSARGPATLTGDTYSVEQDATEEDLGANYAFEIRGSLSIGEQPGDPYVGWSPAESYTCGWPKSDPAPYEGDYVAAVGGIVPDGVFLDVCEDAVRLHDFAGSYLVIEISAMDCGPCQEAAGQEEDFVAELTAEGIPVYVVTMLAPSLSNTGGTPTTNQLQEWIEEFELTSPVLADRAWGLSVYGQYDESFGYPTFIVVAPDLEILHVGVGFGGYSEFAEVIRADVE